MLLPISLYNIELDGVSVIWYLENGNSQLFERGVNILMKSEVCTSAQHRVVMCQCDHILRLCTKTPAELNINIIKQYKIR